MITARGAVLELVTLDGQVVADYAIDRLEPEWAYETGAVFVTYDGQVHAFRARLRCSVQTNPSDADASTDDASA